ncbi:MAG: single-stranded DNA-binding protein [Candidatus Pacebacteria bacterium]|nr:single-stranded DNA-binding protein [Candidatus Paceibacterota bacterium]
MNLNKVFVLGRLTSDPQLRSTTSGAQVASFSLATNRVWKDKAGAKQEQVEFHNIIVWGKQAEVASKFLAKGSLVLIEGRLQTRGWEDKQGQKRKTTEIIAEAMQLGPRSTNAPGGVSGKSDNFEFSRNADSQKEEIPTIEVEEEIKAEDLPF